MTDWDEAAHGPEPTQEASDRLEILMRGGAPDRTAGPVQVTAAALGTPDEWADTAIGYLKCMTSGAHADAGMAVMSVAAVSILLGYVERLQTELGIIQPPPAPGTHDA